MFCVLYSVSSASLTAAQHTTNSSLLESVDGAGAVAFEDDDGGVVVEAHELGELVGGRAAPDPHLAPVFARIKHQLQTYFSPLFKQVLQPEV
jgi:hypothetical protein